MKTSTITKIGIFIFMAFIMLIWGLSFLKNEDFFNRDNVFLVEYSKVDGLLPSSPVLMNGFKIGQVTDIQFKSDNSGDLLVKILVKRDFHIPKQATALIYSLDLMGTKGIRLIRGEEQAFHANGDTLNGSIEGDLKEQVNAQMAPLKNKAEKLLGSMDSILTVVQNIFNENARNNLAYSFLQIRKTLQNLANTTSNLDTLVSKQRTKLGNIIANVESITYNMKSNNEQLNLIMKNFAAVSDSLAQSKIKSTIEKANLAMQQTNSIMEKINSGQGSIGLLLNNDTLYYNLESASKNLSLLLKDIRQNPKRYVRFSAFDFGKSTYVIEQKKDK